MKKPYPMSREPVDPRTMAISWAMRCEPGHPLRVVAARMVREALEASFTKREAAARLGYHEVTFSYLLRDFPELKLKK